MSRTNPEEFSALVPFVNVRDRPRYWMGFLGS